ncbi:hypothetical protein ES708_04320 [subsurface metagenome]
MHILGKILRGIDAFTKLQGYIFAPLCITLIVMVLFDISARQFGLIIYWGYDIEWFQYAYILMLSLGYAVLKDQHVRIDLITTRYSPRVQAVLMAFSYAVFVIPLMIIIAINAWEFSMFAKGINEVTQRPWYCPLWPIKFAVFVGVVLMLPQCFAELTRNIIFVIKKVKL